MIVEYFSLQQARQLCPGVITIPYEFEWYIQSSQSTPLSNLLLAINICPCCFTPF